MNIYLIIYLIGIPFDLIITYWILNHDYEDFDWEKEEYFIKHKNQIEKILSSIGLSLLWPIILPISLIYFIISEKDEK